MYVYGERIVVPLPPSVKPENFKLTVNDSTICRGDVISITCSAEGKPAVHTYQLFENEIPVTDGNSSAGVWTRVMSTEGDFTFRCVANNNVGTSQKNVTVTVRGTCCNRFFLTNPYMYISYTN